ncbi:MAG: DNA-binding protein [Planctomycetaceae bacterium]|jgi:nucleoid DNA-binding protein|nr:DNA-binding protein [Planctomycetaceae bacterium]
MAAKAMSKSQVVAALAESTGLTKADIGDVIEKLSDLIGSELGQNRSFNVPGLMKVTTRIKKGREAGMYGNPFKPDEPEKFREATPPSVVVKVRPLKALKEMAPDVSVVSAAEVESAPEPAPESAPEGEV